MINRHGGPTFSLENRSWNRHAYRVKGHFGLRQDKSRKVRLGWGRRIFSCLCKVIFPFQGIAHQITYLFNYIEQGVCFHGAR